MARFAPPTPQLLITLFIQVVVFQQFMMPVLLQSAQAKNSEDPMTITKYTLTLAIPSLLVWLCMFYALFHLWLNILAEATCFGDRQVRSHEERTMTAIYTVLGHFASRLRYLRHH